jgi:hypothetical protein
MSYKKVDIYNMIAPEGWEPDWLRMSPTMKLIKNSCGFRAFLKYILKIYPKKDGMSLLRGRIVHRYMQLWLQGHVGLSGFKEWYTMPIKQALNKLLLEYTDGEEDLFKALAAKYEWPRPFNKRSYYTLSDFREQLFMHSFLLQLYFQRSGIMVAKDNGRPLIEESITFPLITRSGEIIEKANGEPLMCKNIIDLIAVDADSHPRYPVLIDWKIGMKKYTVKEGMSDIDTNFAVVSYAGAVVHQYANIGITWPIKCRLVHTVVNKSGDASKSATWDCNGEDVLGIEVFDRMVEEEEYRELVDEYIIDANDMRTVNLTKNRGMSCIGMCEYNKLCLKGDKKGYEQTIEIDESDDRPDEPQEKA